jgi:hypothetical protein
MVPGTRGLRPTSLKTLFRRAPVHDVAIAVTARQGLASLKRNKGESAADLIQRLEDALNHAAHGGDTINEINGGRFAMTRPSAKKRR